MKKIGIILLLLLLAGCSSPKEMPQETEHEPATQIVPQALINGNVVFIPDGYVVTHTPRSFKGVSVDREDIYFQKAGGNDCFLIRYGQTTKEITDIKQASSALARFNAAEYYGAAQDNTVAKDVFLINDENTYMLQGMAVDEAGLTYYINSFITRGTRDIYSVVCVYDEHMNTDCSQDFLTSACSDMDRIIYKNDEEGEFTLHFKNTYETWTKVLDDNNTLLLTAITETAERDLTGGNTYRLDAPDGLYTFEVIEGSGQITIYDSRFGEREILIGYNSKNAPSIYEGIALLENSLIKIDGNVTVRLVIKKWKEI